MSSSVVLLRSGLAALVATLTLLTTQLRAEEAAPPAWQEVIDTQIQAFREGDAPTAFDQAGLAFRISFQNAELFLQAVMQSGYSPVLESRSHSFRAYRMLGDRMVLQVVRFVGSDQFLYDAMYQLALEGGAWRVQGVQVVAAVGMAS